MQSTAPTARDLVGQVQRADYEGDRAALARLRHALSMFVDDPALAVRVHYWRGFAMWRRALNGFNDRVAPAELEQDLTECVAEFRAAQAKAPDWVEAKIGTASCLVNQSFLRLTRSDQSSRDLFAASALHALYSRDRGGRPMNHCTESAAILLAAGATISARDKDGITPLALAKRNNLPEMVEFLSARGCGVAASDDEDGRSSVLESRDPRSERHRPSPALAGHSLRSLRQPKGRRSQ